MNFAFWLAGLGGSTGLPCEVIGRATSSFAKASQDMRRSLLGKTWSG
jgi:hypothetical protein